MCSTLQEANGHRFSFMHVGKVSHRHRCYGKSGQPGAAPLLDLAAPLLPLRLPLLILSVLADLGSSLYRTRQGVVLGDLQPPGWR